MCKMKKHTLLHKELYFTTNLFRMTSVVTLSPDECNLMKVTFT